MPPLQHAVLSASAAHRWLACPPSAMLEKELPDETTVYAEEGSVAHEVAEYKVKWYLGERDMNTTPNYADEAVQRTREKSPLENIMTKIVDLDREIDEDIDALVDFKAEVWEQLDKMQDERQKRILWLHYAERKTWGYIADDVYLTRRHVIRLHKMALDTFDKILRI